MYRLTAEDMRGLYETETDNYEQFLRNFVCGYADTAATPELPRGNYLLVRAEGHLQCPLRPDRQGAQGG